MRLDHVVVPVTKPEETLAFYGEFLGLPLIAAHEGDDWGGYPWLMLIFALSDGRELVMVALKGSEAPADPRPADARHIALSEEDPAALDAWEARLKAAGADYWEEAHGERRSLYVPDPNGLIVEITWPPTDARPTADPQALAAARRWIAAP